MQNTWTIYRREISAYFNSPIAYIFILLFVLILSGIYFVVNRFFSQPSPDIRNFFMILPWAFAVFIPAVTMRLWAEEKRAGTIEILMTLPVRAFEVVAAKFLAGFTVIAISLLLTVTVPLLVAIVIDVDWGAVLASYIGGLAIASVYISLGAWVSTFTRDQVVALLIAVVLSLVACFIGVQQVMDFLNNLISGFGNFVGWFGTLFHFQNFARGLVSPVGLIYAIGVTAFFLVLNNVFVEGRKF